MELQYVYVTVFSGLVIALIVRAFLGSRNKNLPPGPKGLPLIGVVGSLLRAKSDPVKLLSSWADQYGDIVSFKAGPVTVVTLNSYDTIVEGFRHPDLNDRPKSKLVEEVIGVGYDGVAMANGPVWREQRGFIHSVFRNLGVGKKNYEDTIATEIDQLMAAFSEKKGALFNPSDLFTQAIANIICSVVFGTQYEYSDSEFQGILHRINTNLRLSGGGGALIFLPLPGISKIPFGPVKELADNMRKTMAFFREQIESHEKNLDPANPRDFIDLYLVRIAETKDQNTSFNTKNLVGGITDLFFAGTETTATTLKWCVLNMMVYPEVQSRVQEELDRVVGRTRSPSWQDRNELPYTNATLLEIQRMQAVAPIGVPHVAAADVELRGYTIPKGATILPNIHRVLRNKDLWEDPNRFNPDRFLDKDGKLVKKDELIFFSAGRRVCLGEQLARMETYLTFTSLLHRFAFRKPDNSPPLSFEGVLGVTFNTKPFLTCAVARD